MHVVVVGCGRVGSELSRLLTVDGHTVAVIDRRPDAFRRLDASFAGRKVVGVGFDRDRLGEAGIEEARAVAAVTSGDNSNILVARVARERFGIERVVARIYDPRRAAIYQRLGIPTVATVEWTTLQVLRRIVPEDGGVEWTDPAGGVQLLERPLPAAWAGRVLAELEAPGRWRLAALTRLGASQVPTGGVIGQDGDVLHWAVATEALRKFDTHLAGAGGGADH